MNTIKAGLLSLLLVLPSCYAANEKKDTTSNQSFLHTIKKNIDKTDPNGYCYTVAATVITLAVLYNNIDTFDSASIFGCLVIGTAPFILNNAIQDDKIDKANNNTRNTYLRGVGINAFIGGSLLIGGAIFIAIYSSGNYKDKIFILNTIKLALPLAWKNTIYSGITRFGANCGLNFYHWMNTDNISTNKINLFSCQKK